MATWNIAAINNNPFEYWITHDDADYNALMEGVQSFIDQPGERDAHTHTRPVPHPHPTRTPRAPNLQPLRPPARPAVARLGITLPLSLPLTLTLTLTLTRRARRAGLAGLHAGALTLTVPLNP